MYIGVSTCGGSANDGADCMFPFIYDGIKYQSCTLADTDLSGVIEPWCYTDPDDTPAPRSWGYCNCAHNSSDWNYVDPSLIHMCDGFYLGTYALAPVNGIPTGSDSGGPSISKENARISVDYCLQQIRGTYSSSCSTTLYIGVNKGNGDCFCAKAGGDCSSGNVPALRTDETFFKRTLPSCNTDDSSYLPGVDCECLPGFKGIVTRAVDTTYSGICVAGEL